jgi:hypothetical protein
MALRGYPRNLIEAEPDHMESDLRIKRQELSVDIHKMLREYEQQLIFQRRKLNDQEETQISTTEAECDRQVP